MCLPRNLHFEVHKVLCLPRNLHFEVHHKVLRLPRNLHFEVHQVLCLPRNLHFEVHQSAVPATKSALRGSQSAAPATKSHYSQMRGHRNLHFEVHKAAPTATKSANEPHVQKSRFTAPVTKSELLDDHHHVQSAAPATKTALRSKTAPIPCTCHEKSTLKHQNTRFPLRLPRKVTTMYENAHGTTTRAQSREALAPATQISRACAVEMHFEDFERHECTVNSSELASHARALQRSKHQLLYTYRKNP